MNPLLLPCRPQQLSESLERLKVQSKELKEAHSQRRLAVQEFSSLSEQMAELRSAKQRLTRQLRDRDDQADAAQTKMDSMKQEVRKADRARKEVTHTQKPMFRTRDGTICDIIAYRDNRWP